MTTTVRSRTNRLLAGILATALTLCAATTAGAQVPAEPVAPTDQSALSVSPAIVDNTVDPGVTFKIDISLANQTGTAIAVRASTKELVSDQPVDPARIAAYDASSWFTLDTPDFILGAQERKPIAATVEIPKSAEPGGHYATINFDSFSGENAPEGATTVNARVGVVVLLTVSGDIKRQISPFGGVRTPTLQTDALPSKFEVTLSNDGNVHVLPQGQFVVRNIFGKVVKRIDMPLGTLLPGTDRTYSANWEHGLVFGVYSVETDVMVSDSAQLGAVKAHFLVAPLVIVGPVLVLLLVGLVWWLLRRRRKRRRSAPVVTQAPAEDPTTSASVTKDDEAPNLSDS